MVAARRLGRDLTLLAELLRPAAGTRYADPKAGRCPMAGRAFGNSRHHTLAQING